MRINWAVGLACALVGCCLLGCGTVQEHRARQYSVDFAKESQERRQQAVAGEVLAGMRPVSVYVALGTPEHAEREDENIFWWIYFGYSEGESGVTAEARDGGDEPLRLTPRFFSRSELRIPSRGEERQLLQLWFEDDRLIRWHRRPLRTDDLRLQRESQYGRIPDLDSPRRSPGE